MVASQDHEHCPLVPGRGPAGLASGAQPFPMGSVWLKAFCMQSLFLCMLRLATNRVIPVDSPR
jgi:hypothetical protein